MNRFFNHDFIAKSTMRGISRDFSSIYLSGTVYILAHRIILLYHCHMDHHKIFMAQRNFRQVITREFPFRDAGGSYLNQYAIAGYQDIPNILAFILYLVWTLIGLRQVKPVNHFKEKISFTTLRAR